MEQKEKKIFITRSQRRQLRELINCSDVIMRRALKGKCTTYLHAQIRQKALELGGIKEE